MNKNTVERIATLRGELRKNSEAMEAKLTPAKFEALDCERVRLERELAEAEAQREIERGIECHEAKYRDMESELARLTGILRESEAKLDATIQEVGNDIGKYFPLGRHAAQAEAATAAAEPVMQARVKWSGDHFRRQNWLQKMREFRSRYNLDGLTPRPGESVKQERRSGPVDPPKN